MKSLVYSSKNLKLSQLNSKKSPAALTSNRVSPSTEKSDLGYPKKAPQARFFLELNDFFSRKSRIFQRFFFELMRFFFGKSRIFQRKKMGNPGFFFSKIKNISKKKIGNPQGNSDFLHLRGLRGHHCQGTSLCKHLDLSSHSSSWRGTSSHHPSQASGKCMIFIFTNYQ